MEFHSFEVIMEQLERRRKIWLAEALSLVNNQLYHHYNDKPLIVSTRLTEKNANMQELNALLAEHGWRATLHQDRDRYAVPNDWYFEVRRLRAKQKPWWMFWR
jgi:hypothetical protein